MVEEPVPRVMEEPGARVWPEMMYWDLAFAVTVCPSTVTGGATVAAGNRLEVLVPYTRAVLPLDVCSASAVVEEPEPRITVEPGVSVSPDTMYWDWRLAVIVCEPMMNGGGVVAVGERMEVLGPYTSATSPLDVCSASTWFEEPEPRFIEEPGASV